MPKICPQRFRELARQYRELEQKSLERQRKMLNADEANEADQNPSFQPTSTNTRISGPFQPPTISNNQPLPGAHQPNRPPENHYSFYTPITHQPLQTAPHVANNAMEEIKKRMILVEAREAAVEAREKAVAIREKLLYG